MMKNAAANVLIVDDEQEISELLEENLKAFGFSSVAVADGEAMFAELEKRDYDLILLDIMMPGEDGLSLCRRLRARGHPANTFPSSFLRLWAE